MNNIKSIVCTTANKMVKDGYIRLQAFMLAWEMVKRNETYSATQVPVVEDMLSKSLQTFAYMECRLLKL